MKTIKIISGSYGYKGKGGIITAKKPGDAPFELEDSKADRLISLKVAELAVPESAPDTAEGGPDLTTPKPPTKKELMAKMDELGVEYDKNANWEKLNATLTTALDKSDADTNEGEGDSDESTDTAEGGPDLTTPDVVS